jgi:hypothetical protein
MEIKNLHTSEQNIFYKTQTLKKYPTEFIKEYFEDESFEIKSVIVNKDSDIKYPKYLELELLEQMSLSNIEQMCSEVYLTLEILQIHETLEILQIHETYLTNCNKIFNIPLKFLIDYKNYEINNNIMCIEIPFSIFMDGIELISIYYSKFKFSLLNSQKYFVKCNIVSSVIYLESKFKEQLINNPHRQIIQSISSIEMSDDIPIEINFDLPSKNGLYKGFFIEQDKLKNIKEISMISYGDENYMEEYNYDYFMIKNKCMKISDNLLYFPLEENCSYLDKLSTGFEYLINDKRITDIKLYIKLIEKQSKICIYELTSNLLSICSSICGLAFGNDYKINLNYRKQIVAFLVSRNDNRFINKNK